jgi:uncharacterized membrane protein YozB (DUF420 family)
MWISLLPTLNAILNATSGVLIVTGYVMIRRKKVREHRACMVAAVITSLLFLTSYIIYHSQHGATRFAGVGIARPVYFTILISHTFLAIVIVPLVIITLRRALGGRFAKHMAIARWTFPLWVYVSITGVVVYLMLYHLYPAR